MKPVHQAFCQVIEYVHLFTSTYYRQRKLQNDF